MIKANVPPTTINKGTIKNYWSGVEGFNLFGFIRGTESWIGFLPVYPPNWDGGETKGKMMATKKSGQTKDCHKDKADHSPVCICKKGQKMAQNRQKMAAQRQSSLEKYYELGPAVAQGHLDSALWAHWSARLAGVSSIGSSQEDVLSRSNVFCASAGGDD